MKTTAKFLWLFLLIAFGLAVDDPCSTDQAGLPDFNFAVTNPKRKKP